MFKNLFDDRWVFYAGDDMQGRINAAGAWMRRSGDLDWALAFFTDFDIDMAYRDVGQGREQDAEALNTRFSLCCQVIAACRSAAVFSSQARGSCSFRPLPRLAGVA